MTTKAVYPMGDAWDRRGQVRAGGEGQALQRQLPHLQAQPLSVCSVASASLCEGSSLLLRKVSPHSMGGCFGKNSIMGNYVALKADIIAMAQ